jgi:4-hydroxy-4-methyl-2-oxoglutarate aldolase
VIVLASNGYTDTSMGGGTKLLRLHQNGCAGVLTDGRLRDYDELARYDFAAYGSGEATRPATTCPPTPQAPLRSRTSRSRKC